MTDHQGKRKMKFSTQVGKVVAQRGLSANHQSRECACPSSWLVSHMPAGYEILPFPHNCLFVTSFLTARPATHQHQWFMTSFNQALVGHGKREGENPPDTSASVSHLHLQRQPGKVLRVSSPPQLSGIRVQWQLILRLSLLLGPFVWRPDTLGVEKNRERERERNRKKGLNASFALAGDFARV